MHWDGRQWGSVHYPDQRRYLPSAIYALSPTDMWLYGYDSAQSASILHWTNGTWKTMPLPVNSQNVLMLTDDNIWVEGGELPGCCSVSAGSQGCSVTSHWNGSSWTSYPLRVFNVGAFAGGSSGNVWAVGDSWERPQKGQHDLVPAAGVPLDRIGVAADRADSAADVLDTVDRRPHLP